MVRGKFAGEAVQILQYQPQRAARMLEKVIKERDGECRRPACVRIRRLLVLGEVRIDKGPMFRRLKPKARGMATILKKRMSHITVVLSELE